jgi:hypothetical protein
VLAVPITLASDPNACQSALEGVTTNVQAACADASSTGCTSATAAALSAITLTCGVVADAQQTNSVAFASGVSQAEVVSCSDATYSAFDLLCEGCTGGTEFAPFVESSEGKSPWSRLEPVTSLTSEVQIACRVIYRMVGVEMHLVNIA